METVNGNEVGLYIAEQVDTGSGVPANPEWHYVSRNTGDFTKDDTFTKSDLVDSTGQAAESTNTGVVINASIDADLELANSTLHKIIAGVLQSDWSTTVALTDVATISFDNAGNLTDTANSFANLEEGQFILIGGAANAENNGVARILTKTDDNNILINKTTVTEAAGSPIDISARMIRLSNQPKAFSAQKRIPSSTNASSYDQLTYIDMQFGQLDVNVSDGALLSTSISGIARRKLDGVDPIAGQTDGVVTSGSVAGSVNGVTHLFIDNVAQDYCEEMVTDISITVNRNMSAVGVIGCQGPGAITTGQTEVGGSYVTMVDKAATQIEMDKKDNETKFSLAVGATDNDGNVMMITRDSCKYTALTQSDTANGDLLLNNGTIDCDGKTNAYGTTIQIDYMAYIAP